MSRSPAEWLALFAQGREEFLTHLSVHRGCSPHTLRAYSVDLSAFIDWLTADWAANPPEALSEALALVGERYVSALSAHGRARTTIRRRASSLRAFFRYLTREQWADSGELPLRFRQPKLAGRLPHFLSADTVERLLAVQAESDGDPLLLARDRAMVLTLFTTGLRVGELVGIHQADLRYPTPGEPPEILIRGKGGRERLAFLSDRAWASIQVYQQALLDAGQPADGPLFRNAAGTRLSERSVGRILSDLGERIGLTERLHPHLFRHSFATHLLNHGVDLRVVQELLGHRSIASTQVYTHVTTERLRRAYLAAHPMAQADHTV